MIEGIDYLKELRPDLDIEVLDPYTFFRLEKQTCRVWTGHLAYEAESQPMMHLIGEPDGDGGWTSGAADDAGYLLFGPYATNFPVGQKTASFALKIDQNTGADEQVARLEVCEGTDAGNVIASRIITRSEFGTANSYQLFDVPFTNQTAGLSMQFRVYWYEQATLTVDRIDVLDP